MMQGLESANGLPRQRNTLAKLRMKRVTALLYWGASALAQSLNRSRVRNRWMHFFTISRSVSALNHHLMCYIGLKCDNTCPSPNANGSALRIATRVEILQALKN
jgi:hypothetical protein